MQGAGFLGAAITRKTGLCSAAPLSPLLQPPGWDHLARITQYEVLQIAVIRNSLAIAPVTPCVRCGFRLPACARPGSSQLVTRAHPIYHDPTDGGDLLGERGLTHSPVCVVSVYLSRPPPGLCRSRRVRRHAFHAIPCYRRDMASVNASATWYATSPFEQSTPGGVTSCRAVYLGHKPVCVQRAASALLLITWSPSSSSSFVFFLRYC